MKKEQLSEALSFLDDDIIKETDALRQKPRVTRISRLAAVTRKPWFKISAAAAVVAIVVIGGLSVFLRGSGKGAPNMKSAEESVRYYQLGSESNMEDVIGNYTTQSAIDSSQVIATASPTASPFVKSNAGNKEGACVTASGADEDGIDFSFIKTFCNVTVTNGKIKGSYGLDLSEDADYYIELGKEWELEMLKDDEWEIVQPKSSVCWVEPIYFVGRYAGTNHFSEDFDLNGYENLKEGHYRIFKNVYIVKTVNGDEEAFLKKLYFEFDLKF